MCVAVSGLIVLALRLGDASGYELATNDEGEPLKWGSPEITVDVALDGKDAAAHRAFETWLSNMTHAVPLTTTTMENDPDSSGLDYRNVARWVTHPDDIDRRDDALATTILHYSAMHARIIDADIVVNAVDYEWTDDPSEHGCDRFDLQSVLTHEAGHFLGLDHSADAEAVMFPRISACDASVRTLAADDIDGVNQLYDTAPHRGGCAASPDASGVGAAFVALLMVSMMRRRLAAWAAAGAVLAVATAPSSATTMRWLDVDELTQSADVVAVGTPIAEESKLIDGRIHTVTTVEVAECWLGICGVELEVRELGGEVGDDGLYVFGAVTFDIGQPMVIFLRRQRGALSVVGMAQGAFDVAADGRVVRDLTGMAVVEDQRVRAGAREVYTLSDVEARVARERERRKQND